LFGKLARGKKCDAIEGIFVEGKEIMEKYKGRRRSMSASSRRDFPLRHPQ
jgi:ferritin-like metal-binding protein YciE